MNRNKIVRVGAIVMILSMLITIFIGAMSVKAATFAPVANSIAQSAQNRPHGAVRGVNPDIDGDGILNNDDGDIDGDGIDNGLDPDIDGDGVPNNKDGNPASTNNVDSVPPKDARFEVATQWVGGLAVLAVLGWLVALPYIRKRRGKANNR
ncbi:MAG: hypothetical protein ACKOUD_00135 [Rhodoluna sp.]